MCIRDRYFLRKAGVPRGVATSQYVNHSWNVVNIVGKCYHVDATWDDPTSDIPGRSMHDYFLVSFDTLNSKTKAASSNYYLGDVYKRQRLYDKCHQQSDIYRKSQSGRHCIGGG